MCDIATVLGEEYNMEMINKPMDVVSIEDVRGVCLDDFGCWVYGDDL